jgi:hypothetical protein
MAVSSYGSETSPAAAAVTPTASTALEKARALVARVRDEVIPREGLATNYGVSFSQEGYQTLIQWNEEYKVEPRYADTFESLHLGLPCCGWSKPIMGTNFMRFVGICVGSSARSACETGSSHRRRWDDEHCHWTPHSIRNSRRCEHLRQHAQSPVVDCALAWSRTAGRTLHGCQ